MRKAEWSKVTRSYGKQNGVINGWMTKSVEGSSEDSWGWSSVIFWRNYWNRHTNWKLLKIFVPSNLHSLSKTLPIRRENLLKTTETLQTLKKLRHIVKNEKILNSYLNITCSFHCKKTFPQLTVHPSRKSSSVLIDQLYWFKFSFIAAFLSARK